MTRRSPRSCAGLYAREIPDAVVTVFRAPPIQGLGNAGGFKLQVEQRGFVDLSELQSDTDKLVESRQRRPAARRPVQRLSGPRPANLTRHRPHEMRIAES